MENSYKMTAADPARNQTPKSTTKYTTASMSPRNTTQVSLSKIQQLDGYINKMGEKVLKRNEEKAQRILFDKAWQDIKRRDNKMTPFQQASISGRLETVKHNGNISEKRIEERAFWEADKQRIDERVARERCKSVLKEHQDELKKLWKKNLEKIPKRESPGPGHYGDMSGIHGNSMQNNEAASFYFGKSTRLIANPNAKKTKKQEMEET